MTKSMSVLLAGALALFGCGGDPLIGTWHSSQCPFTADPAQIQRCAQDTTFNADGSTGSVVTIVASNTAQTQAGCTFTTRTTGVTWSETESGATRTVTTQGNATVTVERAGCVRASDDQAPTVDASLGGATTSTCNVTINGDTMTTTCGSVTQTFSRTSG